MSTEEDKPNNRRLEPVKRKIHKIQTKIKSLREAFSVLHGNWIELINIRNQIKITDAELTPELENWQRQNHIFLVKMGEKDIVEDFKFHFENELIIAVANFMYENLKSISRGKSKKLKAVGNFGEREVNALLNHAKTKVVFEPDLGGKILYHNFRDEEATIPALASALYRYLEYMEQALNGLEGKAKIGIFKVIVCPYHKFWQDECGRVEIVTKFSGEACREHLRKWQEQKRRIKNTVLKK